jgi:hypothetical protein
MKIIIAVLSVFTILAILLDGFEVVVLPRRVTRRFRFIRLFYRLTWIPWRALARFAPFARQRETLLGYFGPLSLILLLCVWAGGLVIGFASLQWSLGSAIQTTGGAASLGTYLYLSGTTFFTLGYGDVTPLGLVGRSLAVIEAGLGFGILALVIGYLPVIYQAFGRRETIISLLDARAGSPPSAAELLRRHSGDMPSLNQLLRDWEHWSADLMESHISYPPLCFYRSQHNNQSWITALTAVLDASALVIVGVRDASKRQAELTFAMARHAVVDLSQTFNTPPCPPTADRLPAAALLRMRSALASQGVKLADDADAEKRLHALREMYEPYVNALAAFLLMPLPEWIPYSQPADNWRTSAWFARPEGH